MFLVPANFSQFYSKQPPKEIKRLLNWKVLQANISWGVVFLLGGGFALAFGTEVCPRQCDTDKACNHSCLVQQKSGLSTVFSEQLKKVTLQPTLTTFVLVLVSASVTEMASNVATANVILPVICQLV